MPGADSRFHTEITADPAQGEAAFQQFGNKVQAVFEGMRGEIAQLQSTVQTSFGGIQQTFAKLQSVLAATAAAVAGTAFAKSFIDASTEWASSVGKLSKVMGTSTEEASVYAVALKMIGMSTQDYTDIAFKLLQQIKKNEDGVRAMGLATRDTATGALRPMNELTEDGVKLLLEYKEGVDRDAASMYLFGKGAQEAMGLLKLNGDIMNRATELAQKYDLVVGKEGVAAARAYKLEQAAFGIMIDAVKEKIGSALLPVMTSLAGWFQDIGPTAISVATFAIKNFIQFLEETVLIGRVVWNVLSGVFETVGARIGQAGKLLVAFIRGEYSKLPEIWRDSSAEVDTIWKDRMGEIERISKEANERIAKLWGDSPAAPPKPDPEGSGTRTFHKPDKDRMATWEAELAAERDAYDRKKLEQGSFEQYSLQAEAAFWANKMLLAAGNTQLLAQVTRKYYDAERQIRKQAFEAEVADLKGQMAAATTSAEERIQLAGKVYQLEVQYHKANSKEAKEALKDVQKAYDDWAKQQKEIRDLRAAAEKNYQTGRVELERQNLDTLEQLGIIKAADKLKRLRELKDIEYAIELKALDDKLAIMGEDPTVNPVKYQELLNQIRALKEKHVADMQKLDGQIAVNAKKTLDDWLAPIGSGFQKLMDGMIQGTQKWGDIFKQTISSVAKEYAAKIMKMGTDWASAQIFQKFAPQLAQTLGIGVDAAKTAAQTAAQAALTTATTAAATASTAVATAATADTAALTIQSTATAALTTAIVALTTAVAANTAAMAANAAGAGADGAVKVASFAAEIFAAPNGFDVPALKSPLTRLHPKEMVLPAPLADVVRGLAANGGAPAAAAAAPVVPVQLNGVPMPGGFFMAHKNDIAEALHAAARNGWRPGR